MKELRAKVEDVSQRNVRYRLIKGSGSKAAASTEQSSHLAAATIFGIDDARRAAKHENQRVNLLELINREDEELKVIAVWGTSGDIGQTSIIRAAYENQDVQSQFPTRAWVRVMHPFSAKDFVQSLVNQFRATEGVEALLDTQNNPDAQSKFTGGAWVKVMHPFGPKGFVQSLLNQFRPAEGVEVLLEAEKAEQGLARKFNEFVNEKRYFVVLNGLTTIEEWDQIKRIFPDNKKGSRIVVSTTQVEVASLCAGQDSQASELKQLSPDQTLYVFYEKASQNGKESMKPTSSSYVATTGTTPSVEIEVVKKSFNRIRTSAGFLEESQLIGREKEISKIMKLISNKDNQQGHVISVWGMGGLGKTTLVNGIYQSHKLSDVFEKRAFVTIMRPFKPEDLLSSLVVQLREESSKKEELLNSRANKNESLAMMGVQALSKEIKRLLEMRSCLIILDDLSSTTEWDQIIQGFYWMGKTTRIIVTTRKENIANHCSGKDGIVHNLEVLKEEDAFNLLSQKVFGRATNFVQQNPELIKEANQILRKCGGLPLAIVIIGGYLANRPKTGHEWRRLNENISAELEMNPELGTIRTILEKSYDGLPYHLKSCFLYLSIFPEDHIISRRRLVRRWTAEGYSSERRGKSANEMAESYFMELKYRSMILPSQQSVHSRKSIDSCKVHDLIRDIAISKSMEENLVFRVEEGCGLSAHGAIRHLAISSNWKGDRSEFESIVDLSRLRSLTLFGKFRPFYISDKMRLLRVLDLEGIYGYDLKYHQLDNIWKLLHLKYLSLRGCYDIDLLPDSLGNLRQLQVLDVRNTCVKALPKTLIKLRKLQYIHAGRKSDRVRNEKYSLMERCLQGACLFATCCLPTLCDINGPCHKVLTRHDACTFACCVDFPATITGANEERGAMVPRGTRKLKELHTLREVNVGRGIAVLHDIKMLTGLRKLGVSGINKKNGPAFRSAISNLRRLESLSVSSAGKPGLRGCLDDISSPPENLQSLKLYGNLETLPEWIKELPHLVKFKLVSSRLLEHDAAMEFLGKLPKLEILVLSWSWSSFDCEELDFKSAQAGTAFERLRVLTVQATNMVKSVKIERGTMTKLERLYFAGSVDNGFCFSGLESLASINEVGLYVSFHQKRRDAAQDSETRDKPFDEVMDVQRRKRGELKKKIQEQLAGNANEPIVMVDWV